MMLGWLSAAEVRASRLKRSTIPAVEKRAGDITLIATLRSSATSWARYTEAMPPCPSSPLISYSPIVAWRNVSIKPVGVSVMWEAAVGVTYAVATCPCCPETSAPQLEQTRAPGGTAVPQREQVASGIVSESQYTDSAVRCPPYAIRLRPTVINRRPRAAPLGAALRSGPEPLRPSPPHSHPKRSALDLRRVDRDQHHARSRQYHARGGGDGAAVNRRGIPGGGCRRPGAGGAQQERRGAAARQRPAAADPADRPSRRGRGAARRLVARSVHAHRARRVLLRPGHERHQGHGGDLRRYLTAPKARRRGPRPRHHPRAHSWGGERRRLQRRAVAARQSSRADRRRLLHQRRRRRSAVEERPPHRAGRGGEREGVPRHSVRGAQSRRP